MTKRSPNERTVVTYLTDPRPVGGRRAPAPWPRSCRLEPEASPRAAYVRLWVVDQASPFRLALDVPSVTTRGLARKWLAEAGRRYVAVGLAECAAANAWCGWFQKLARGG